MDGVGKAHEQLDGEKESWNRDKAREQHDRAKKSSDTNKSREHDKEVKLANNGSRENKGKPSDHDRSDDPNVEILEKGEIFFFYRPKVEREHPTSTDDVQRMYMILNPEVGERREMVKQSHVSGKEGTMEGSHDHGDGDDKEKEISANLSSTRSHESQHDHVKEERQELEGEELQDAWKLERSHEPKSSEEDDIKKGEDKMRPQEGSDRHEEQRPSIGPEKERNDDVVKHNRDSALNKGRKGGYGEEKANIENQQLFRFIILGRKGLPDASKRTRPYWGFVELVTTNRVDINRALGPETYGTSTRGERHIPAARPTGEGRFCIAKHKKGRGNRSHTHLVYKLELPEVEHADSPQTQSNIGDEGSFIIQVKNPNKPTPPNIGLGNKRRASYPAYLQSAMGYYRFIPLDPCDFLNFEGCEFILISASDDFEKELDLHLGVQHDESSSALLHLFGEDHDCHLDVKPLMEGEWA